MGFIGKFCYYQKVNNFEKLYNYRLKDPIFIVGCGHSGTSILLSVLSNHPRFYTIIPESYIFHRNEYHRSKELRLWVQKAYYNKKHFILEKTPSHCLKIRDIFKTFVDPKIIAVIRDGRDVCCSLKKRSGNFKDSFNRWVYENLEIVKCLNSKNMLQIRYEDFVSQPKDTIIKVSHFINEDIDINVINNSHYARKDFYNENSDHARRRNKQINENIKDFSGTWKKELRPSEYDLFNNHKDAKYLLNYFNYI